MKTVRTVIIDDEPLAHTILKRYCERVVWLRVEACFVDTLAAVDYLRANETDLLFLDVQMPDLSGLDLMELLGQNRPHVVFTTAHTRYALRAFDYDNVLDYLLKPIGFPHFLRAVNRLDTRKTAAFTGPTERLLTNDRAPQNRTAELSIRTENGHSKIDISTIEHLQSYGNYVKLHRANARMLMVRTTLGDLLNQLPEDEFVRIHKSYVVACWRVSKASGRSVWIGSTEFPLGRMYKLSALQQIRAKGIIGT